jgi:hypothetical protein
MGGDQTEYVLRIIDTNKWYWCKCEACGWEDSSEYAGGGHPIADTGDHTDPCCPVCGSYKLDGEPVCEFEQYSGIIAVKIPLDVYLKPYKWAVDRMVELEEEKRWPLSPTPVEPSVPAIAAAVQIKGDVTLFKEFWYKRNPVHDLNADSGEDMFWGTAELVAREYVAFISVPSVQGKEDEGASGINSGDASVASHSVHRPVSPIEQATSEQILQLVWDWWYYNGQKSHSLKAHDYEGAVKYRDLENKTLDALNPYLKTELAVRAKNDIFKYEPPQAPNVQVSDTTDDATKDESGSETETPLELASRIGFPPPGRI